ncbi:hypothetical protein LCGC14_2349710, partial [marine sediment metagenome]
PRGARPRAVSARPVEAVPAGRTQINAPVTRKPGLRYRSFDRADDLLGTDVSSSALPFQQGGSFEAEFTARPGTSLGPTKPGQRRGPIEAGDVKRIFVDAQDLSISRSVGEDLTKLQRQFPDAEFSVVGLADDAETRIVRQILRPFSEAERAVAPAEALRPEPTQPRPQAERLPETTVETLPGGARITTEGAGQAREIFDFENQLVSQGIISRKEVPVLRRQSMDIAEASGELFENVHSRTLRQLGSVETRVTPAPVTDLVLVRQELIDSKLTFLADSLEAAGEVAPTGGLIPVERGFRRIGGFKRMFPEIADLTESPGQIVKSIRSKRGKLFEKIEGRVAEITSDQEVLASARFSQEVERIAAEPLPAPIAGGEAALPPRPPVTTRTIAEAIPEIEVLRRDPITGDIFLQLRSGAPIGKETVRSFFEGFEVEITEVIPTSRRLGGQPTQGFDIRFFKEGKLSGAESQRALSVLQEQGLTEQVGRRLGPAEPPGVAPPPAEPPPPAEVPPRLPPEKPIAPRTPLEREIMARPEVAPPRTPGVTVAEEPSIFEAVPD